MHTHTHTAAVASPDISWTDLALSHELTGGLIRNAVLAALAVAINESGREEGEAVKVKQEHLMAGARLQLRYGFQELESMSHGPMEDLLFSRHSHTCRIKEGTCTEYYTD